MLRSARAIEVSWGNENATLSEPIDSVTARFFTRRPEVQTRFRIIYLEAGFQQCAREFCSTNRVGDLLPRLLVMVVEGCDHGLLDWERNHETQVLTDFREFTNQRWIANEVTCAVRSEV